jgi:hypothetical protein
MARRCVWGFWEATTGSLSEARIAVSSVKVAMEVGMPAVKSRYKSGPRTLPWGTPEWIGDKGVYADATYQGSAFGGDGIEEVVSNSERERPP